MTVEATQQKRLKYDIVVSGGRHDNPTLEEYLDELTPEWKSKIKLLADYIKGSEYYKITADKFCNDNHFIFSDGTTIAFTWRAWGDFMQAIVGEREGYMKYYM